jgi:hypothetical protein
MKRKMLTLAILLGTTVFASSVPRAEATLYDCGSLFCSGKYSNTLCYCSAKSERPGWSATCGSWKVACYR